MKYCTKCGKQLEDDALFCTECGTPCGNATNSFESTPNEQSIYKNDATPSINSKKDNGLRLVAFIFCVFSCVATGLAILPLIWMIPLTVKVYNSYKDGIELTTGVKVCVLLFVNLISGILLLVEN